MPFSFSSLEISNLESRFRANLIQSALGYKPLMLLGSQDKSCQINLAIFNNLIHVSANPPVIGIQFRPADVERHSLQNILDTGFFSLNQVPDSQWQAAHQTSAKYDKGVSEFEACGFTPTYVKGFDVPLVAESPLSMVLKFTDQIPIGTTGVTLVLGTVVYLSSLIEPANDGFIDPSQNNIIASAGSDAYYKATKKGRLSYARPFEDSKEI